VLEIAERHVGANRNDRLEDDRLAFLALHHLDVWRRQGCEVLIDDGLAIGVVDKLIKRLLENRSRTENALEHDSRGLPRAKTGDTGLAREPPDGLADGAIESLGREIELELEA
jgi:hypothetical protein